MTIQEKLGNALRRLRNRQGLSQEAVALAAHIDRRYMSDVENGKRNVSLDILERLAHFSKSPCVISWPKPNVVHRSIMSC